MVTLEGATKSKKRVGRGIGSGKGKTCGRGVKGQKSRSGVAIKGFEGGQQPIYRRLPKRGFNSLSRVSYQVINLGKLQEFITAGKLDQKNSITREILLEAGLVRTLNRPIKILNKGVISVSCTVEVDAVSKSAQQVIEKSGGKVVLPVSPSNA